jgi:hypothetical protein
MANEDSWTQVGKGGKSVIFPPDAASAFGNRKKTIHKHSEFPTMASDAFGRKDRRASQHVRAEFDTAAAAAFGSKQKRNLRSENVEFDASAASVFGSKQPRNTRKEFDDAAAAAFGRSSRREEFPSAFGGKKHSGFAEAAQMGFDDADGVEWKNSAFGKKRAMGTKPPEPKKQTYEEMFPSLCPVTATPTAVKAPAKESFADLVRARAEQDEAEAAAKAERERFEENERRRSEYERNLLRRIHQNRPFAGAHTTAYDDLYEMEEEIENDLISKDLDCDAYGAVRNEAVLIENTESSSSSDDEDEFQEEEDAYWTRK